MKVRRIAGLGSWLGGAYSLVPGQTVRGRIVKRVRAGRYRLSLAGQLLEADSDLALEDGQKLTAKVELEGERVLLRILEEAEQGVPLPAESEGPEEIKRILQGLGLATADPEISEFLERLKRYQPHANLPGIEPSDVWVLAIMWSRGLRGGAEAFALLSFYLRCLTAQQQADRKIVSPEALWNYLSPIQGEENPHATSRLCPGSNEGTEVVLASLGDRKREAVELLNQDKTVRGTYLASAEFEATGGALVYGREEEGNRIRWTDHPVTPRVVMEVVKADQVVSTKAYYAANLLLDYAHQLPAWKAQWQEYLRSAEMIPEEFELREVADGELLRFIFWRSEVE